MRKREFGGTGGNVLGVLYNRVISNFRSYYLIPIYTIKWFMGVLEEYDCEST